MAKRLIEKWSYWNGSAANPLQKRPRLQIFQIASYCRNRCSQGRAKLVDQDRSGFLQLPEDEFLACDEIVCLTSHIVGEYQIAREVKELPRQFRAFSLHHPV